MARPIKKCPQCGVEHQKRGPYCSQSCGNVRVHDENAKRIRSEKLHEYHATPEGAATRRKLVNKLKIRSKEFHARANGEYILQPEDYAVEIPNFDDTEPKINW